MTDSKKVCEKHEQAYPADEHCPWCPKPELHDYWKQHVEKEHSPPGNKPMTQEQIERIKRFLLMGL